MSRLPRLVVFEARLLLRERLAWAIFAALFVALLVGAQTGASRVAAEHAALARAAGAEAAAVSAAREAFARYSRPSPVKVNYWQDPTNAFGYMTQFLTVHAVKPPLALAALTAGQSDVQPSLLRMNFGFGTVFDDVEYELGSAAKLKLGPFDLAFVLVALVPLGIIALAGTRLSAEHDSGTLRLIAAQPVGPGTVATAKFGALAGIAVLAILSETGLALLATGALRNAPGAGGTLALLGAVLAAYILLWVAACAFVATLWRGAVASLSILVLAWTLVTVAIPGAASIAADLLVEKPSRIAAIDASRRAQETFYNGDEGPRLTAAWLARIPGGEARADLRDAPEVRRLARDAYYDTRLDAIRAAFRAHGRDVAAASRWLALLSPATAFDLALQGAAGTDAARHAAFLSEAASYRATLRRFFEPRIVAQVLHPVPVCAGCQGRLDFDAYESVPRFEASRSTGAGRGEALAALVLFLALGLGLTLAARVRLRAWPV